MSKFNLRPLSIALLGITTTSAFAETTAQPDSLRKLDTIVVSASVRHDCCFRFGV